ncbi:hypothetical protein BDV93DRAFT_510745 [Ceratobasidium sp. AG-I]|nr:hypothetical protein BDV93DRAFT_510745 [Ceratobasidium sp. AG-I]
MSRNVYEFKSRLGVAETADKRAARLQLFRRLSERGSAELMGRGGMVNYGTCGLTMEVHTQVVPPDSGNEIVGEGGHAPCAISGGFGWGKTYLTTVQESKSGSRSGSDDGAGTQRTARGEGNIEHDASVKLSLSGQALNRSKRVTSQSVTAPKIYSTPLPPPISCRPPPDFSRKNKRQQHRRTARDKIACTHASQVLSFIGLLHPTTPALGFMQNGISRANGSFEAGHLRELNASYHYEFVRLGWLGCVDQIAFATCVPPVTNSPCCKGLRLLFPEKPFNLHVLYKLEYMVYYIITIKLPQ